MAGLSAWLWEHLGSQPAVYVVGDSITALSQPSISAALTDTGYQATISATPGVKLGQAQTEVRTLAQHQPWAWIIELGTDDAGASNAAWPQPFLEEWASIAPATCVIYVTVSPRAGPVAMQIDSSIATLAGAHPNVHVLDWGQIEYGNSSWVSADGIHPTPQGETALAGLELQELRHAC
ncbi:MAG TPA: hypothetical protein VG244_08620 [Acidimicrobiales bacterium]|nr:hypothetical protein [Acidimicrobiales bacterium]